MARGEENVGLAFGLVIAAGLSTAVGASLVLFGQCVYLANKRFLAGSLGISAGVMLYVSFVEIFGKSLGGFEEAGVAGSASSGTVYLAGTLCFFGGILLMMAIDKLVHRIGGNTGHGDLGDVMPTPDTSALAGFTSRSIQDSLPSSPKGKRLEEGDEDFTDIELAPSAASSKQPTGGGSTSEKPEGSTSVTGNAAGDASDLKPKPAMPVNDANPQRLTQMGIMTAVAIGIHNFPEGLATFVATLDDPNVGSALAVAIGIHNIPEGLCVSIPIFYATGSRWKALGWALMSGVSEPIGALLGYLVLKDHMGPMAYGLVFGFVGGMMVYICLHELIPTAHRYDPEDTVTTLSILFGMGIMALSLVLFVLDPEESGAAVAVVDAGANVSITSS